VKTLLVTQDFPPRPGGMARYYADLARGLGGDCTVAAGSWKGEPPRGRGDHQILPLPFDASASHHLWNLFRTSRLLGKQLVEDPPQVLIGGNIRPFGLLTERLARRKNVPLVQIYHGGDILQTARKWKLHPIKRRRWTRLVNASAIHAVNSRYTAGLAIHHGFPEDRLAVVPPEVDTDHFSPAASEEARRTIRHRLGWRDQETVTLFTGRLVDRKGLDDLFAALLTLPESNRVAVAGPGDLAYWKGRALAAGVESRVDFLGPVDYDDLPDLYRGADLFVGPSRDTEAEDDPETFGIVFLEAAASGLPVVATRTGGIPEAVNDGINGFLVTPGDISEIAAAWRKLAEDEPLRLQFGRAGRNGPARTYGTGSSARALEKAVQEAQELG
jgi:phosphatidylinositol alpha-1,6-mannosyltransferase